MTGWASRAGAVCYALWGVVHVLGGGAILATTLGDGVAGLAMMGTGAGAQVPASEGGVVAAVTAFHAWNLLWMGGLVLGIALTLNWQNSRAGYWINLTVVACADIGLLAFLVVPGVMQPTDAIPGPLLWLLAWVFSTIGLRGRSRVPAGTPVAA